MARGNLVVRLTDMGGEPLHGRITIDLTRVPGEPGSGGESMRVAVPGSVTDLTITGITCRSGPGTMYRVLASVPHYRPYAFFQLIRENRDNTASDDVEFFVKPGDVRSIHAPSFDALPSGVRAMLDRASMQAVKAEDEDLVGLSGGGLYQKLGPLRKACLLNIGRKTSHARTTEDCLPLIDALLLCRQDRLFAGVSPALPERLRRSPCFRCAPGTLHEPLPGYRLAEGSFKSRDAHASLQVTFMRHVGTGALAADIDIDEASGIEHGREVIRNATFRSRTNPYLIREFMLNADPLEFTLSPGYRFAF